MAPAGFGPAEHIAALLGDLGAAGHVINPYSSDVACCPDRDLDMDLADARLHRLTMHLRATADSPLALVGEAAGWRGARQTGVAFTAPGNLRPGAMREASATVVQSAIAGHRLPYEPRLFNAYPLHPHRPGLPRSNRAPTARELASTRQVLRDAVEERWVIAVGVSAAHSWASGSGQRVPPISTARPSAVAVVVRHPSFGGASTFRREFAAALAHFGTLSD